MFEGWVDCTLGMFGSVREGSVVFSGLGIVIRVFVILFDRVWEGSIVFGGVGLKQ